MNIALAARSLAGLAVAAIRRHLPRIFRCILHFIYTIVHAGMQLFQTSTLVSVEEEGNQNSSEMV